MTISLSDLNDYLGTRIAAQRNILFGYANNNHIGSPQDYLFDSPHGYWSHVGELPKGHSSRLTEAIANMMAQADHWVDVVTMDVPNGEFLKALIAGIGQIRTWRSQKRITVRILIGASGGTRHDTDAVIRQIHDGMTAYPLPPGGHNPSVYVAQLRWRLAGSWNHGKLLAVDGRMLLAGGHNMWSQDYLKDDPVYDLSLRYDGPIAFSGHVYANGLWAFVANWNKEDPFGRTGSSTYSSSLEPSGETGFAQGWKAPPNLWAPVSLPTSPGRMPAIWVTNMGWGVWEQAGLEGSGGIAFHKALQTGKNCWLSQQDLGNEWKAGLPDFSEHTVEGFPYRVVAWQGCFFNTNLVHGLAALLLRDTNARLNIVLSDPTPHRSYNNGVSPDAVFNVIGHRMATLGGLTKDAISARLCNQLFLKIARQNNKLRRNHAKFWMVDDLFYVGSENLYPPTKHLLVGHGGTALLQEYGVICEDPVARSMLLNEYFNPLFNHGMRIEPTRLTW